MFGATGAIDLIPVARGEEGLLLAPISGMGGFGLTLRGGRWPGLVWEMWSSSRVPEPLLSRRPGARLHAVLGEDGLALLSRDSLELVSIASGDVFSFLRSTGILGESNMAESE